MLTYFRLLLTWIAHSDRVGITAMRIAIAIVFLWIGALKFAPYEADSITPFVANSPVMSFFYKHPTDYKAHLTREGELNPADRAWQTANDKADEGEQPDRHLYRAESIGKRIGVVGKPVLGVAKRRPAGGHPSAQAVLHPTGRAGGDFSVPRWRS